MEKTDQYKLKGREREKNKKRADFSNNGFSGSSEISQEETTNQYFLY